MDKPNIVRQRMHVWVEGLLLALGVIALGLWMQVYIPVLVGGGLLILVFWDARHCRMSYDEEGIILYALPGKARRIPWDAVSAFEICQVRPKRRGKNFRDCFLVMHYRYEHRGKKRHAYARLRSHDVEGAEKLMRYVQEREQEERSVSYLAGECG